MTIASNQQKNESIAKINQFIDENKDTLPVTAKIVKGFLKGMEGGPLRFMADLEALLLKPTGLYRVMKRKTILDPSSKLERRLNLWLPAPAVVIVAGLTGLVATPLVGVPALASAAVVGVAAGYAARVGDFIGSMAGGIVGCMIGGIGGASAGAIYNRVAKPKRVSKMDIGISGMIVGGLTGVIVCGYAGIVAAGMMAYSHVKAPADKLCAPTPAKIVSVEKAQRPAPQPYKIALNAAHI